MCLGERPVFLLFLDRQTEDLEENGDGHGLGYRHHELATPGGLHLLDEFDREGADIVFEGEDRLWREGALQRCAVGGVQRRIERDRRRHERLRSSGRKRGQHRLELSRWRHLAAEAVRVARRLVNGSVAAEDPVSAVARGPEYGRCFVDDLEDARVRIAHDAWIAEAVEIVNEEPRHVLGPGERRFEGCIRHGAS